MSALPPGQALDHLLARSSQLDEAVILLGKAWKAIAALDMRSPDHDQVVQRTLEQIAAFLSKVAPK
jgi:hypothetical protein